MSGVYDKQEQERIALAAASLGATVHYGVTVIHGLITGNLAAIAALVTFKSGATLRLYSGSLICFSAGFTLSLLCGFLSYISQSAYTGESIERGDSCRRWAIGSGFASFIALALGGVWAFIIGIG